MSIEQDIEIALFTRAKQFTALPLFFPNYDEIPPVDGKSYIEVRHFRNDSIGLTLSHSDYGMGILQMLVCSPLGKSPQEALKHAGDIVALFPKADILWQGTTRVKISKRPVLGTAAPTDTKYELPVSIYYEVSI